MPARNGRLSLIFDLGGVIVDHADAKCFARLIELLEARPSHKEIAGFIAGSGVGVGSMGVADLFEKLRERYGSTATQDDFLAAWTCHFTLKPDVYDLLGSIKDARPFVICSNTNAAHWDYVNRLYGLDRLAQAAVLSHECGFEKPEPEIYLLAAAAHGRRPEECFFVDDRAVNVDAAKALGFHAHHFVGFENLRQAVEM